MLILYFITRSRMHNRYQDAISNTISSQKAVLSDPPAPWLSLAGLASCNEVSECIFHFRHLELLLGKMFNKLGRTKKTWEECDESMSEAC